jgi:asparagine synthase (glutamine-hydrolysing)
VHVLAEQREDEMVAIYGIIGGAAERSELEAIGRRLRHHGEHELVWSPAPGVLLGWRSDAAAPGDAAGPPRAPLVFAGSILNRQELAASLGRDAGDGSVAADASLLWDLYRAFGADAFARVNGQFAVALADPDRGALVLTVDRWAARPLYFVSAGGRGAFASEYKALLALGDVPARPNLDAVNCLQATKYLPAGQGMLVDVPPVAPGGCATLRPDGWRASLYPPLELKVAAEMSEEEHAAELREALLAATRRLVEGVDPIGIALSAGLDSTATLGAVRAVAPDRPVHTFTASFHADDPDLRLAAEAARHFGTVHQEIILRAEDLPRLLPEMVWAMEDPVAREEMVVYQALTAEAAKKVPLVLYGQMADKLFAGMPRHLLVKVASELPLVRGSLLAFYDYTQTGAMRPSLLGKLLVAAYYRGRRVPPPQVLGAPVRSDTKSLELVAAEPLNATLLAAAKMPTEVAAMERLHSRVGLRYGSIFHDREVAECAFRIPDRLKIRGRTRKYILRRATEGILPPALAARPKGLIRMGRDRRLVEVIDAMADELLAPEAVARRGLFDPREVARLRRAPVAGRYRDDQFYHLWTLLLTEIWSRTFLDGRGAAPVRLRAPAVVATAAGANREARSPPAPDARGWRVGPNDAAEPHG